MDHIELPISGLTRPSIAVPYTCTPRFTYDDQGFSTYPIRVGVDFELLCKRDQIVRPQLASFLQSWLWFGLLGETLGVGFRTNVEQAICSFETFINAAEHGRPILETTKLREVVRKRRERLVVLINNDALLHRFDWVLKSATRAINAVLETESSQIHVSTAMSARDFDGIHTILLSCQILIDSLQSCRQYLFTTSVQHTLPNFRRLEPSTALVDVLLRESGWCQPQITTMDANLQIRYFLSFTYRYEICNEAACRHSQHRYLRATNMAPVHTRDHCNCDSVGPSSERVSTMLHPDTAPLVTFGEILGGRRQLEISHVNLTSLTDHQPFIAFSHVRSMGLGNSSNHLLPYCQLSLLQEIANDTVARRGNPVPFYIDTICLPLLGVAKHQSLATLPMLYGKASVVIVLDPSLTSVHVGSDVDCFTRIRHSAWQSRLWTLQEGSHAKKIVFKFANRTFDLDEGLRRFVAEDPLCKVGVACHVRSRIRDVKLELARLHAFDKDLKRLWFLPAAEYTDERKMSLRTMLRLGYLSLPRYDLFRGEKSQMLCSLVMHAAEDVYYEPTETRISLESDVLYRLRRMEIYWDSREWGNKRNSDIESPGELKPL